MSAYHPKSSIQIYADAFDFAEAKKFLAIKGCVRLNVVHDSMYPLWRYGQELIVDKLAPEKVAPGMAVLFWREGVYHPCLVKSVAENHDFEITFLNSDEDMGQVESKFLLGQVVHPKLGLLWKLRLWFRQTFAA